MFLPLSMRIALIHYSFPPIVGGVEGVIAAHAQLFLAAGHEVIRIARRGAVDRQIKAKDPLAELRAALAGVDAVFVHNVLSMPFDLPLTEALWQLAAESPSVRWVAWVHDLAALNPDYDHPWHRPPWERLAKASPHFRYVAVSAHRARQFETLTGTPARVIPNGVHVASVLGLTKEVAAFAARHRLLSREFVLFHPTRLLRRKNVEFGIEVIAALRRSGRDAALVITGASDPHQSASAEYAAAVRARRDELDLGDHVLFAGDAFPVSDADVAALYALGDALFFPSRQEGFGLPVLEAALHRLPIFCSDIEPINALLDRGVHCFAPDASATDVAQLVARSLDRSAPHRSRRKVLAEYAWEAVWARHLAPLLG